jgi:hypothetical protein
MGAGLWMERRKYSERTAFAALGRLIGDGRIAARAAELGERVRGEYALASACDAVEDLLTA